MPGDENPRRFRLHFEGPLTRDHTLPASALVQALEQLQRIVHLLAMAHEGREVRQRARVTHDIERRFPLVCLVPEEGGYALPVDLGDTSHQLFDEQTVEAVATRAREVITAVNSADGGTFNRLVPDSYFQRGILAAFNGMQPHRRSGIVVSIEDYKQQKLLDGETAQARIEQLLKRPKPSPAAMPAYVTGALIEMKFQERRLRLQLLGSGQALDATYSEDFEPILLDHPRELIQVHGNVVYIEDGSPSSISDVDEILEVDDSAIEVLSFSLGDLTLQTRQPLSFDVTFDQSAQVYEASGSFGVLIGALTRPDLEAQLDAELAMLWREYAQAEPETLTNAARDLRQQLLAAFSEINHAA
ncbi:MAG TPA: hypothetical protein P5340_10225 [Defluviicoccus sp.]|nr:hypothetical protein [Defluviicoccus sp.]